MTNIVLGCPNLSALTFEHIRVCLCVSRTGWDVGVICVPQFTAAEAWEEQKTPTQKSSNEKTWWGSVCTWEYLFVRLPHQWLSPPPILSSSTSLSKSSSYFHPQLCLFSVLLISFEISTPHSSFGCICRAKLRSGAWYLLKWGTYGIGAFKSDWWEDVSLWTGCSWNSIMQEERMSREMGRGREGRDLDDNIRHTVYT